MADQIAERVEKFFRFLENEVRPIAGCPLMVDKDLNKLKNAWGYSPTVALAKMAIKSMIIAQKVDGKFESYIELKKAEYQVSNPIIEFKFKRWLDYFSDDRL